MSSNERLSIAQLVERRTVEVRLLSLGHWFESGSGDQYFLLKIHIICRERQVRNQLTLYRRLMFFRRVLSYVNKFPGPQE